MEQIDSIGTPKSCQTSANSEIGENLLRHQLQGNFILLTRGPMLFVDVLVADFQATWFDADGTEADGFVEFSRCWLTYGDGEENHVEFWEGFCFFDSAEHQ